MFLRATQPSRKVMKIEIEPMSRVHSRPPVPSGPPDVVGSP
jgi:hypothetical protein